VRTHNLCIVHWAMSDFHYTNDVSESGLCPSYGLKFPLIWALQMQLISLSPDTESSHCVFSDSGPIVFVCGQQGRASIPLGAEREGWPSCQLANRLQWRWSNRSARGRGGEIKHGLHQEER
jgi:hypothetical protein